ncbi:hypothetical protein SVIOM342S_09699 [Streptomyces violaceorubidus]
MRAARGVPVPDRTVEVVQLVVSELLTNACKYAPGPSLVDLELAENRVEVAVWDSAPVLPVPEAADPGRMAGTGWRSSWPSVRASRCTGSRWASA